MQFSERIRAWARRIKRDGLTLWFARKHPATPWYARLMVAIVVAYALSPVDLIPDFIPVLGYLDDVLLLPALIWLTVRMLPEAVMTESRAQADQWLASRQTRPRSIAGAVAIAVLWLVCLGGAALWLMRELAA